MAKKNSGVASDTDPTLADVMEPPAAKPPPPNPFDPASLKLPQNFAEAQIVKKALLTVPVRKPAKEWWVQTHPSAEYQLDTMVLALKEDNETYLIARDLWPALAAETTVSRQLLVTAINNQGVLFIWHIRMPDAEGKIDSWNRSAFEAANEARGTWVRVQADKGAQGYQIAHSALVTKPAWPEQPFGDLLRIAFKDRYIDSLDHPVLKRLRGEL